MSDQPYMDRCLVLEARVAQLEAALREIASLSTVHPSLADAMRNIASAALKAPTE